MDSNEERVVAACGSVDVDRWWQQIQDLWLDWFAGCFGRVEVRRAAWSYVEGLMSLVGRKNCWWLGPSRPATPTRPGCSGCSAVRGGTPTSLRDALLRLVAKVLAVPDGVFVVLNSRILIEQAKGVLPNASIWTLARPSPCFVAVPSYNRRLSKLAQTSVDGTEQIPPAAATGQTGGPAPRRGVNQYRPRAATTTGRSASPSSPMRFAGVPACAHRPHSTVGRVSRCSARYAQWS